MKPPRNNSYDKYAFFIAILVTYAMIMATLVAGRM